MTNKQRSLKLISQIDVDIDLPTAHPLRKINTYHVLPKAECQALIEAGEQAAQRQGGWATERHVGAPTTDIPFYALGDPKNALQQLRFSRWQDFFAKKVLAPILLRDYQANFTGFHDLFLVKYTVSKEPGARTGLTPHRDGTILSFVLTLNENFSGGGTYIQRLDRSLHHQTGDLSIHCGWFLHGGTDITAGERYVLIGFCEVEAPWLNQEVMKKNRQSPYTKNLETSDIDRIRPALLEP